MTESLDEPQPSASYGEYDGVVVQATRVWRRLNPDESPTRQWDVRIRYDTEDGPREGRVYMPSYHHITPGAEIIVRRSRSGKLRITPVAPPEDPTPGKSWKRPDLKAGLWGIVGVMALLLIALIAVIVFLRSSIAGLQGDINDKISQIPTPTPSITEPASTEPVETTPAP